MPEPTIVGWMMLHPWMTFFILLLLIETVGTLINNVIKVVCYKVQEAKDGRAEEPKKEYTCQD